MAWQCNAVCEPIAINTSWKLKIVVADYYDCVQCNCNYKISLFVGFILELFTCTDLLFLPIYTHYKLFRNCFNHIDVSILYRSIIVIENSNWIEFSVEFQGIYPLNAWYYELKHNKKYVALFNTIFCMFTLFQINLEAILNPKKFYQNPINFQSLLRAILLTISTNIVFFFVKCCSIATIY